MRKTPNQGIRYNIDIREFLGYEKSAVISKTLSEVVTGLSDADKAKFLSRKPGCFDFRVQAVLRYVSEHIRYQPHDRTFDAWLFPEETLA